MPAGQANTTWFPELIEILQQEWDSAFSIDQQFQLVEELNKKLSQIREERNIQPPMFWCLHCKERHRSEFSKVSINSTYFALKRFEICSEEEFKRLRREWNKYSKQKGINVYGEPKKPRVDKHKHKNNEHEA